MQTITVLSILVAANEFYLASVKLLHRMVLLRHEVYDHFLVNLFLVCHPPWQHCISTLMVLRLTQLQFLNNTIFIGIGMFWQVESVLISVSDVSLAQ